MVKVAECGLNKTLLLFNKELLDSIGSFGRPKSIELLVLINRRFSREIPIEPKYIGKSVDVINFEKVKVDWKKNNVVLLNE